MLKFNIHRRPRSDHNSQTDFQVSLFVGHLDMADPQKWLQIRFATGGERNTSIFEGAIYPRDFASVAAMMVNADPEAAIRAFGKAMETAKIQRRDDQSASDEAA